MTRLLTILTILTIIIVTGCKTYQTVPVRHEEQLRITKRYIGQVAYTEQRGKYTLVVCGFQSIELCGQVSVPAFVYGYVRTEPCYWDVHPDIKKRLEHKYFTWRGSDKEYKIKTW